MLPALVSRLQTSLYSRTGFPAALEPVASSPYRMSLEDSPVMHSSRVAEQPHANIPRQCKHTQNSPEVAQMKGVGPGFLVGIESPGLRPGTSASWY